MFHNYLITVLQKNRHKSYRFIDILRRTTSLSFALCILLALTCRVTAQPAPPPPEISDPAPAGIRIAEADVFANYFRGAGAGRHPGILLLSGSEGGLGRLTGNMATALASEGFSVLQLCYFGCPGLPEKLVGVPVETFSNALRWMRHRPDIDPGRIGILGGSKGSEAALLAASRDTRLKAVVATQPSSVVWPGIAYSVETHPGWLEHGKALAYLPYARNGAMTDIFAQYNDALGDISRHPEVVIPVERITAKIMLVCGEADRLWPSCPMADQIQERLAAHSRPAALILKYPDAGHEVFGLPIDPSSPHYQHLGSLGGTPAGIAAAHADAWPKVVAFFKEELGS
jgi:hypothetical protein